ncbi:cyclohex-1-ene-1-carboxylate:CoA ligase [Frankia sp. R43]|uniref:AMP-binding protein n=1 Tax=Frankia sp. R43 TaxID=269536 RepID=UPI0006C9F99A|nr:AMP-binding protein [Frankia sp. R43]KPM56551.1 cyclohex-1-ene-1-carboxylate:CoA ligase [Frankia sp. R43]
MTAPGWLDLDDGATVWELVRQRATLTPDAPLLIIDDPATADHGSGSDSGTSTGTGTGNTLSCAEFAAECERVAAGLHALGIGPGSAVSWQLPTRPETVVLSTALARLGAVQNPIIHIYREREVGFALAQTGAELFCVPGRWRGTDFQSMAQSVAAALPHPPRVLSIGAGIDGESDGNSTSRWIGGLPTGDPATLPPPPPATRESARAVRWIYYTSGTTSDPKGVRHSDSTLIAGGHGLAAALGTGPADVGSIAFPFAHIGGPDYLIMMLVSGFPALLLETFDPAAAIAAYRRAGVTIAGGSTAFYAAVLGQQRAAAARGERGPVVPTLRMLSGGGAPKPPELFAQLLTEAGVPIVHGYGMTEAPMITSGRRVDTDHQLAHTDGHPVLGVQVRIVRPDGTVAAPSTPATPGASGEPGAEGEIRVRGATVFHGYTDPALTAAAFDDDGWFRTGDLGTLDADGHLTITGRLKDVIIRKGENISAKEIEDLLFTHPKVGDVAVIGLPDPERGERVCAVVEPLASAPVTDHPATGDPSHLTFAEMTEHLRAAGLARHKVPEQLEVAAELPRNATLKILKHVLRDRYGTS